MICKKQAIRDFPYRLFLYQLTEFKHTGIELVIFALLSDERIVVASLYYFSVFENHYRFCISYRRETVSNNEYRSAFHKLVHTLFNVSLSACID